MFSISMEQRVVIKSLCEEGHGSAQIHSKLVEHYGDMALSYPDFSY
jgi:cytochrome c-type biogenesis protein CcmH/NrfF